MFVHVIKIFINNVHHTSLEDWFTDCTKTVAMQKLHNYLFAPLLCDERGKKRDYQRRKVEMLIVR